MTPAAPAAPAAPDARALLDRPAVVRLLAALAAPGEETRIVGGALRNALLGLPVHDIDLATTLRPDATARMAAAAGLKAIPTGIEHGTVTVVVDGTPFEVTTLREDVETDGRHAVVRFGRDFATDARRRDFTVNALSLAPDGRVADETEGLADLAARRIRFIGDPATRIREDYLRILRFFRFHAAYGAGPIDREGLAACIAGRDGLARLSRERVRAELLKLLAASRGPEIAALLQEAGLLGQLVAGVGEPGRLARATEAGQDAVGRLAAWLVRTVEDADRLRDELRLSGAEHGRLAAFASLLARLLSRCDPVDCAEARRLAATYEPDMLGSVLPVVAGEKRPVLAPDGAAELARFRDGAPPPRLPLTGADLVRRGIAPGPEIGRILAEARAAWARGGLPRRVTWVRPDTPNGVILRSRRSLRLEGRSTVWGLVASSCVLRDAPSALLSMTRS